MSPETDRPSYLSSTLSQLLMVAGVGYVLVCLAGAGLSIWRNQPELLDAVVGKMEGLLLLLIGPYAMREGMRRGAKAAQPTDSTEPETHG